MTSLKSNPSSCINNSNPHTTLNTNSNSTSNSNTSNSLDNATIANTIANAALSAPQASGQMTASNVSNYKSVEFVNDSAPSFVNPEYQNMTIDKTYKNLTNTRKNDTDYQNITNRNTKTNSQPFSKHHGEKIASLKNQIERQMKAYVKQEEYDEMLKLIKVYKSLLYSKIKLFSNLKFLKLLLFNLYSNNSRNSIWYQTKAGKTWKMKLKSSIIQILNTSLQ